jgi:hypothetical protein
MNNLVISWHSEDGCLVCRGHESVDEKCDFAALTDDPFP